MYVRNLRFCIVKQSLGLGITNIAVEIIKVKNSTLSHTQPFTYFQPLLIVGWKSPQIHSFLHRDSKELLSQRGLKLCNPMLKVQPFLVKTLRQSIIHCKMWVGMAPSVFLLPTLTHAPMALMGISETLYLPLSYYIFLHFSSFIFATFATSFWKIATKQFVNKIVSNFLS